MRQLLVLAVVAQIGLAPVGIRSASARALEEKGWQGVTVQEPGFRGDPDSAEAFSLLNAFLGNPTENGGDAVEQQVVSTPSAQEAGAAPSMGDRLNEVYRVDFEDPTGDDRPHIPEVQGAEFMVVIVKSGEFVLDVKGPGSFLVDPVNSDPTSSPAKKIPIMKAVIYDTGTERAVRYEPTGQFVPDERGSDCTRLCTVLPGVAVQVTDGDRIIAPAGAICIWCLLNRSDNDGDPLSTLYVFPLLGEDDFSWSRYAQRSAGAQEATPYPNGDATPEMMVGAAPWALFNPSSNCKG